MSQRIQNISRLLALLAAMAVIFFLTVVRPAEAVETKTADVATMTHRVSQGDNLWQLASPLTEPGGDVRVTVNQILEINQLDDAALSVGQIIHLPVVDGADDRTQG